MTRTTQKLIPFKDPLDPALVPPSDSKWINWYNSVRNERQILNEIEALSGSLAERIKPQKVIWYGHRLGHLLAERKLKYAQLRRFVDALKEIEAIETLETKKVKLTLFQVQLIHGLSRKEELEPFFIVVKGIIANADELILTEEDFARFIALIDSITAYFEVFEDKSKNE